MRIKKWWQRAVSAFDWFGRLMGLAGLGLAGLGAVLMTALIAALTALPEWLLVLLWISLFLIFVPLALLMGLATGNRLRRRHGDPEKVLPTATYFSHQRVYVSDVVRDIDPPVLKDKVFEDCEIIGPAILAPEGSVISHCVFNGVLASMMYELPGGRWLIGVIGVQDCIFRRCQFSQIGWMGNSRLVQDIATATGSAMPAQLASAMTPLPTPHTPEAPPQ
jgi:hypothetical protein